MNLLFITADHQRADTLGSVQAGHAVTPRLSALARDGAHWNRAYSVCPLCVPARAALATGLGPETNGVRWNDWLGFQAKPCVTLHEYLAAAGYTLAHAGMDHVRLGPRLRERAPFAHWIDESDHARHLRERGIDLRALQDSGPFRQTTRETFGGATHTHDYSTPHAGAWPFDRSDFRDEYFAAQAERMLEALVRDRRHPFACFVNFWAPHPPLYVPPELTVKFPAERIELPPHIGEPAKGEPPNRREGIAAQLAAGRDESEWRRAWSAHLALTHLVDHLVGRLLDTLARGGIAEDTLVVFTSDHGDHLGQHAMYQKMELYDQAARVPLLLRGAGVAPERRYETPVSHLDVMPTVLELLALPPPHRTEGRSLASALRAGGEPAAKPVFCHYTGNNGPSVSRHAIISGHHKFIADSDNAAVELYDLKRDPYEMENRAADPARATLRRELAGTLSAHLGTRVA